MFNFFIDTANIEYIEKKWQELESVLGASIKHSFIGITTNPNCFAKENLFSLKEWETRTRELCALVTKLKSTKTTKVGGIVYVQVPSDNLNTDEVFQWARMVSTWSDNITRVALKIPPYKRYLELVDSLDDFIDVNVTGIADCATALSCVTHPVKYISIIPGRMEEVGIDAKRQVSYVMNARPRNADWDVITGSMRTLEGLKWCVEMGTVPTIGTRVLDLITSNNCLEVFGWSPIALEQLTTFAPPVETKSTVLSLQFFEQMNKQGEKTKEDFLSSKS